MGVLLAAFRLSTVQSVERSREKDARSRLAKTRDQKRQVNKSRETLHWEMSGSAAPASSTSAAMSTLALARSNRMNQANQLNAMLQEKELAEQTAQKEWTDAAQRAAAIDKLHAKFLLEQRTRELKDEREQAQEASQVQWLRNRKGL